MSPTSADEPRLYRILKLLTRGERVIQPGTLDPLNWLAPGAHAALVRRGAIAEVQAPPLSELPGWKVRSKKLSAQGIETVLDALAITPETLGRKGETTTAQAQRWQSELLGWLEAPSADRPRG